jgi:hypothetical protein
MSGTTHVLAHALATSPWWIYALFIAGLTLHIGGGLVAILSGYAAVLVRKGERNHRFTGKVFIAAMFTMTGAATAMALYLNERSNIAGGILAAYLTITAWLTVRRGDGRTGMPEKIALLAIAGTAAVFLFWGMQAQARGSLDGYRPVFYFVFGGIATLLAVLDIKVIWQGGVSGAQRIARHLWRMSFAFFFAAGSFFLGQQKIMPEAMHGSAILWLLGLAPLGFMIFWLVRVRAGSRFKQQVAVLPAE